MTDRFFPFHRLGFRSNPFRSLTDEEWTAIAILPPVVLDPLTQGRLHIQLLGQMGAGKSTTLLGLARHISEMGQRVVYEYLAHGQQQYWSNTQTLDVLVLDEAQRLRGRERSRLMNEISRASIRVVLSSHEDLAPLFARCGQPLATVELDHASLEQRIAMINRRLEFFALDKPLISVDSTAVEWLVRHFGTNQRACDGLLYEVFQRLEQPRSITVEDVETEFVRHSSRPASE
jgi:chromosomal replication initiation ATPase DnaA